MKAKLNSIKLILISLFSVLVLSSCISLSVDHFISPRWMIGNWEYKTELKTITFRISQNEIIKSVEENNKTYSSSIISEFNLWKESNDNSYIKYNDNSNSYSFIYHDEKLDLITTFEKIDSNTITYSVNANGKKQESINLTRL